MMTDRIPHPAKFNDAVLRVIGKAIDDYRDYVGLNDHLLLLDPFAGIGRIHELCSPEHKVLTFGMEIEPEWADQHPLTAVGDALDLPFPDGRFDVIATSPCFGNRMADHFDAKDDSRRHTYRHYLGRPIASGSSARMQWGEKYRDFHIKAWTEAQRVLRPNGLFVLSISDHIRAGERQRVTRWHVKALSEMGFTLANWQRIRTPRQRHGANREVRVKTESVISFINGEVRPVGSGNV